MNEQEASEHLEQLIGIPRSFQLMRIYQRAGTRVRNLAGNPWATYTPTHEEEFRSMAENANMPSDAITHYLTHIARSTP